MNRNEITDTDANTVIQSGTTGPINLGDGDQINSPVITGDGVTYINGDNHAPISHTFNSN